MGLFKSIFGWRNKKAQPISASPSEEGSPPKKTTLENPQLLPGSPRLGSSPTRTHLERVFRKFDTNADGKISGEELRSISACLGGPPVSDEELKVLMSVADADGDGFIDFTEFVALNTHNVTQEMVVNDLKEAFLVFDIDKNGSISAEELQKVLKSLGEDSSLAQCEKMVERFDRDGDGAVCFEEFKSMMLGSNVTRRVSPNLEIEELDC